MQRQFELFAHENKDNTLWERVCRDKEKKERIICYLYGTQTQISQAEK